MDIQHLWQDKESLVEVEKYLITFLTDFGVKKMFAGEDVKAVAEAKIIIEEAFDHLDTLFSSKNIKRTSNKNEAR